MHTIPSRIDDNSKTDCSINLSTRVCPQLFRTPHRLRAFDRAFQLYYNERDEQKP